MQKWFFVEDPANAIIRKGSGDLEQSVESTMECSYVPKSWLFRVRLPDLKTGEVVCVTGNVPELGNWVPEKVITLIQDENDKDIWSVMVEIPEGFRIKYRYCVCVIIEPGIQVIVLNWESSTVARAIDLDAISPKYTDEPEGYGDYKDGYRIDRGWLTKETAVQLKLSRNPIKIWHPKYGKRKIYVKVTTINIMQNNSNFPKNMSEALEESLSTDTQEVLELSKHAFSEVAAMRDLDPTFHPQEQFGKECNGEDMLVFQCTVQFPDTNAFLFDFFVYSSRSEEGDPPCHVGFSYLLPSSLVGSEGTMVMPITSTKQRPLGELKLDYIVIRPMPNFNCDLSISYARHWNQTRSGLDVGHRGAGNSFKDDMESCAEVRENTIASLKRAIDHGADFVEFDVQLTKDRVPIIYHDFHVCISMKRKKDLHDTDLLEMPVKELTLEQLQLLKVYHLSEGKMKNSRFFDEDLEEHQPFPTLEQAFQALNPHVGFNIEIKWTMQHLDDSYELYHPTDLNLYIDTILEDVLKHGGNRRIIFSCFNPDVCSMIRNKQNKYPVMFLTQGETAKWAKYKDPRCWDIKSAVQFANMIEILGINVHTEDILRDASVVKLAGEANLVIFCWGDENADANTIKYLKQLGMHGVIFDKIDQNSTKTVKESIFLLEARESQRSLLRIAAASAEVSETPPPVQVIRDQFLDKELVREHMDEISTATSLESLESNSAAFPNLSKS